MNKKMLIAFLKLLKKIDLPKTKMVYEFLGIPEPAAWKHIVILTLPLGLILIPNFLINFELIPAIAEYDNWLNSLIGVGFAGGSILILIAWYKNCIKSQSKRVLMESSGSIIMGSSFMAISLCGFLSIIYNLANYFSEKNFDPSIGVFTFFISLGCALGSYNRAIILLENHWKLLKVVRLDGND